MKRYIKYIISIFSLSCIASCSINDEIANPNDGGQMSLRLVSSTMTRSADDTAGLNEDLLVKADLYLFEADANGDAKGASLWHETFGEFNAETGTNGGATLPVFNIPANVLSKLGSSAKLYVIANYNGSDALPESATLAALQKQAVADAKWGQKTKEGAWDPQSSFVMDGIGDVSVNNNSLTGTIYLTRAAAKIELTITGFTGVPAGGVQDASGAHWLPNFSDENKTSISASVKLLNAVANSYVGAPMAAGSYKYDATTATDGFYTYGTKADNGSYSQLIPFYSYSSDWTAAGGANRASLLLVVPWKKVGTTEVQNCYYEIPIGTRENNLIERNKHYKIGVNVGTLGSFAPSTNVTITPAYITVVDWSTGQTDVSISESRYLVVDEKEISIFNQTDCDISYASSHEVIAKIDSVVFYNYKLANTRTIKITPNSKTITPTATDLTIADVYADYDLSYNTTSGVQTLELPKGIVEFGFTHAIPSYYTPRTIYVTVQHKDNASFSEQVKIVQYPPIYFIGEKATGRVYVNGTTHDGRKDDYYYVYDDNSNNIGSIQDPASVTSSDDATNQNENNYDIYVTVLPSNSTYLIGDPREISGSTLSGINELTKYRKTRTDAVNVIAPAFKIASSRGKTTQVTYDNAVKRCASYQEHGFPAGRWRIPTPAEIEFIVTRSANDDIPSLFDGSYWAANKQYFNSSDKALHNSGSSSFAVRCVYDVWYWGSDNIKGALNKAVWGDAKDNATLNAENPVN